VRRVGKFARNVKEISLNSNQSIARSFLSTKNWLLFFWLDAAVHSSYIMVKDVYIVVPASTFSFSLQNQKLKDYKIREERIRII
jgi:hypothetical protein